LRVVWSLRGEDLPLAVEVLERNQGLGSALRLFVTGNVGDMEKELILKVEGLGATVVQRRLAREDVLLVDYDSKPRDRKYYLCVSPELQKVLVDWLSGEEVVSESFNY
jgi:hypothetical protein